MSKNFCVLENRSSSSVILKRRKEYESLLFQSHAIVLLSPYDVEEIIKSYSKTLDAYACLGIIESTNVKNEYSQFLVMVTGCVSVGKILDHEVFRITQTDFVALQSDQNDEKCNELRKLINSGSYYFCNGDSHFELSLCAQRTARCQSVIDNRFFWNRLLHLPLICYGIDCKKWLIRIMCGFVEMKTVYVGHRKAVVALISRLSSERAGTRFNVRGVNDDGYVANFVETEQVIYVENQISSYLQIRGSIPLFWEQPGVQLGSHKVRISRSYEASTLAFDRHMNLLKKNYGEYAIINLVGTSLVGNKESEGVLSQQFQCHHMESQHTDVPHIIFDYHKECRRDLEMLNKLVEQMANLIEKYRFFVSSDGKTKLEQKGVFRVNCIDCLDRTNCVQRAFGLRILNQQLDYLFGARSDQVTMRFIETFREMWINNGNEISKIYAGTGAIQGSSKIMDGARSAARTIQNNLLDNAKQEAMDLLLIGSVPSICWNILPSHVFCVSQLLLSEMCRQINTYTKPKMMRVAVATYNVNGGRHFRSVVFKDLNLSDWLLTPNDYAESSHNSSVDIYAIGLEEIVDLNASNIVNASSENAKSWLSELEKTLCKQATYVLLTYQQLVGVCLYLYIKAEYVPHVRDVYVDSVKTGMGGHTGNKGAAAVRMDLYGTSLCFVCAHFAAGQSNVLDRNADYEEISKRIAFSMNRTIQSHDYIFFFGDLNYRIDLDKDELKSLINDGRYKDALEHDQLKKEKQKGSVFKMFNEADINFAPTYKYDLFSDDYDTSEKARAPAWTDRILWKYQPQHTIFDDKNTLGCNEEKNVPIQRYYGRAELKQSDHRPVMAVIDIFVRELDTKARERLIKYLINSNGPPDCTILVYPAVNVPDAQIRFSSTSLEQVVQKCSNYGSVCFAKCIRDSSIMVVFNNSRSPVELITATNGKLEVDEAIYTVELKTPDWSIQLINQLQLFTNNTIPLMANEISGKLSVPPNRPPPPNIKRTELSGQITESENSTMLPISANLCAPTQTKSQPLSNVTTPPPVPARLGQPPPVPLRSNLLNEPS